MDILVSSNLERLLYLMTEDAALVRGYMEQLNVEGFYALSPELLAKVQDHFWGDFCDDRDTANTVYRVFKRHGYLCDTHTAAGWLAAEHYVNQHNDNRPMVVLSTASPYKFPKAVLEAIGETPAGDEFALMAQLNTATCVPVPANLANLREKPERHNTVIDKEAMLPFVLGL
jgi:threonine synthase